MARVLYRVILHGPMTWKASHPRPSIGDGAPHMVIFEPASSLVILSHGTILIPQVSAFVNRQKSQILSVFIYKDASVAKSLVTELYNFVDRNLTIFDVYKNDKVLKLLMRSLAAFHLPLEIVLKRVDYTTGSRFTPREANDALPSLHNGLKRSPVGVNPYDFKSTVSVNRRHPKSITAANTVTNNITHYNSDYTNTNYNYEPNSVKNSNDNANTYYLRVGLEEGFYLLTSTTDLMQKVFQGVERKGARVNRLSFSFYKTGKTDPQADLNLQTNSILNANKDVLNKTKVLLNKENTHKAKYDTKLDKTSPKRHSNSKSDKASPFSQNGKHVTKFPKNKGFYTPGLATSPLLDATNDVVVTKTYSQKGANGQTETAHYYETSNQSLASIMKSLTEALDKNTEAINLRGIQNNSRNYSYSTETNLSNYNADSNDSKEKPIQTLNSRGLSSMSTNEFFGYSSPTLQSNSNNFVQCGTQESSLIGEPVPNPDSITFKRKSVFADMKLDDLQLRPFLSDDEKEPQEPKEQKPTETKPKDTKQEKNEETEDKYDGVRPPNRCTECKKQGVVESLAEQAPKQNKTITISKDELFTDRYREVLEQLTDKIPLDGENFELELEECSPEEAQMAKNISNDKPLVGSGCVYVHIKDHFRPNIPGPKSKQPKEEQEQVETDSFSEFSEEESGNEKLEPIKEDVTVDNGNLSTTEKTTTYREDEQMESDLESTKSGELSRKSELNVLMDEFNELSTKNDLLARDNTKYRKKNLRLKEKINNMKSLHKYELEEVMNNSSINEERLRATINDNNVTIKMMEQERLKLSELLEQQKMTIKRVNREKLDAVQQLSRLEDEYNKLQMVREMDKTEKYNYNKAKVEVENLKTENESLNNKLRAANEKLQQLEHSDKLNNEVVNELKEKVEELDADRIKSIQLGNENKVLKNRESQLKEKYEQMKKELMALKAELNEEKSNNFKLNQTNMELQEELKTTKTTLKEIETKDEKLESKMSMLENNNTVLLRNLDSSKAELEKVKGELETSNLEKQKAEDMYRQLHSSVEKVESMNQSLSAELCGANMLLDEKKKEVKMLRSQVSDNEANNAALLRERDKVKKCFDNLVEEHKSLQEAMEVSQDQFRQMRAITEHRAKEVELLAGENKKMRDFIESTKGLISTAKNQSETQIAMHKERYARLVARMFLLIHKHNKLKKENCMNKIKLRMADYKNNTILVRVLFRSVAVSKAKIAKRNLQLHKIMAALNITGPTTTSGMISKINTIMTENAENTLTKEDKISNLKSSFMKHSLEKDQQIKILQTKLVTFEQMRENQEFLLEENRNLQDQIMVEQNNSQKLQQALNEQIERERYAFETESKSLYSRQYQLLRDNDQLAKENHTLKETLNSLLTNTAKPPSPAFPRQDNITLYDIKYERLKNIHNASPPVPDLQFNTLPPYISSPTKLMYRPEFEDDFSFKARDYHPRLVYHKA